MFTTFTGFSGSLFDEIDRIHREMDMSFNERGLPSSIRAAAGRGFPPLNVGATPEEMEVFVSCLASIPPVWRLRWTGVLR
jgi:HSP20 family protein